jgi:hypothetical protein
MITFELKGDNTVTKQIGNHITLRQPLQTNTFSIPKWHDAPKNKYVEVTKLKVERTKGDIDIVFEAAADVELKVDYNKDDAFIGFYGHKGIRNIGFFEHDTNTLITSLKIAKGNKRPITFQLSDLVYLVSQSAYLQAFSELWVKAFEYAQDFKLAGLQIDLGSITTTAVDHHDLNVTNEGEGFTSFDLNTGTAS